MEDDTENQIKKLKNDLDGNIINKLTINIKTMAEKLTKKAIHEALEKLNKASASPKEKLKLLKELNSFVKKTDKMVKDLIVKVKK